MVVKVESNTDCVVKIESLLARGKFTEAYQELDKVDQTGLYLRSEYGLLNRWYNLLLESNALSESQSLDIEAKLGRVLFRLEDRLGAKAVLGAIIEKDFPLKLFAMSVLGAIYNEDGLYDEAKAILQQTIKLAQIKKNLPVEGVSKIRLARSNFFTKHFDEAEKLANEAVKMAKDNGWVRDQMIWEGVLYDIFMAQGKSVDITRLQEILDAFIDMGHVRYVSEAKTRLEKAKSTL